MDPRSLNFKESIIEPLWVRVEEEQPGTAAHQAGRVGEGLLKHLNDLFELSVAGQRAHRPDFGLRATEREGPVQTRSGVGTRLFTRKFQSSEAFRGLFHLLVVGEVRG